MAAKPVPRPLLKMLGLGLFLGVALGAGAIFGLDMLDSSLRYVDQAESFLKLPVLAVVPDLEGQRGDQIPSVFRRRQPQPASGSLPKHADHALAARR